MITYNIKKGTTDVSVTIRIIDATDGTPETAVEHDTAGIDIQYRREGAASTAITETALAALTTAHTDGGIEHIGNGYYRFDLPDAACASGVNGVLVHGTVTGMVVIGCYIHLVDYDPFDTVRLGLTALPNAAADAAGGLPISAAGGLDIDAIKTDTAAILLDTGTDGVILANDAITAAKIATDAIGSDELAASAAQKIRDEILPTQNAAFNNLCFLFVAASDHITPVTGASGTAVTRSIDGASFTTGTGTLAEIGNGIYQYDASAADMNGGVICFRFTATGGTPGAPDDAFVTIVTGGGV